MPENKVEIYYLIRELFRRVIPRKVKSREVAAEDGGVLPHVLEVAYDDGMLLLSDGLSSLHHMVMAVDDYWWLV